MDGPVINPDLSVSVCCMTVSDRGLVSAPRVGWNEPVAQAPEGRDYIDICTECPRYLRHVGDPSVMGVVPEIYAAPPAQTPLVNGHAEAIFDAEQRSYLTRSFPQQLRAFEAGLAYGLAHHDISDHHPSLFIDQCIRLAVRGFETPNLIQTPFSVLLLGTTASKGVSADRDLEFFLMAPDPSLMEQQTFYPFVCGIIQSVHGNVDVWCLMNMLTGNGVQKLTSKAPWRYGDTLFNHFLLSRRDGGTSLDHVFCDLTAVHVWGNLNVTKKIRQHRSAHLIANRKKVLSFMDQQIQLNAASETHQFGWIEDLRTLILGDEDVLVATLDKAVVHGVRAFRQGAA